MPGTVKSNIFKNLFFHNRFYLMMGAVVILFLVAFFVPVLFSIVVLLFFIAVALTVADMVLLMGRPSAIITVERIMANRFSNGDENEVQLQVHNGYGFPARFVILEEVPVQFQWRNFSLEMQIPPGADHTFTYQLRPVERGNYGFGYTNVFVSTALGLVNRRFVIDNETQVSVYPSFQQLRHFTLKSFLQEQDHFGIHRRRIIGQSVEFDHIKPYTKGDDVRRLNWKATARTGNLMVNSFVEEKSQQIYCVIDKGRSMRMPFDGLSLLDYAINATLVFSNIALSKGDKAGLVTFTEKRMEMLPASSKMVQLNSILESLYAQETQWQESDYETLSVQLRSRLPHRSLLVLFTNFESMSGLQRQLPYLRRLAQYHLLLVVFFENTELKKMTQEVAYDMEGIYKQTIAQKFAYDKKLIAKELGKYGIMSILTPPEQLTVNVVNKYLELKSRMLI
ncbi:Uncharacterized conserved protein, DUF58 family, contains vWF domain [Chitinophaga jiangningensis]|uniref:Uncharacterized conserved protein, DUF58 family, contains vWF domain n=1 Tax=Chitinophaga jiangningensis TaxID=1419482 RepID=A0A1M7FUW9_9BACT|nr:DUF58 domain-containing protein [Chitinophaga jiangningensis]SHM07477.1 Uncharacterized conserved protein, DUF58 family, contains vWF domain [Chitinophaga jiangningensis]